MEIYPAVPRPATVDTKELLKKEVETKLTRLGVETTPGTLERYPALPKPTTVDTKELLRKEVETKFSKLAVETTPGTLERYPADPRPLTVDTKELLKNEVETRLAKLGVEIKGRMEEANSVGSINELIKVWSPRVVDTSDAVEI